MSSYLVANLDNSDVPPPLEGYVRVIATCADCQRSVTWVRQKVLDEAQQNGKAIVCARCALQRWMLQRYAAS